MAIGGKKASEVPSRCNQLDAEINHFTLETAVSRPISVHQSSLLAYQV